MTTAVADSVTRCADGLAGQCPQAGRCERTAPSTTLVPIAFYNGVRESIGWCPAYMPIETACEADE